MNTRASFLILIKNWMNTKKETKKNDSFNWNMNEYQKINKINFNQSYDKILEWSKNITKLTARKKIPKTSK